MEKVDALDGKQCVDRREVDLEERSGEFLFKTYLRG